VLVDDQTLVRSGIRGLLALGKDMQVVGEAASGEEALAVVAEQNPDVLLLDIRMPGLSGIDTLKKLKNLGRLPPTLLLTTFDDDEALFEGMRAGAKGFLLKDISLDRLMEVIRMVADGRTFFRPAVTERMVENIQKSAAPRTSALSSMDQLTARESEVLRLMAGGFNNKEIARALDVTEGTVKNHVTGILLKLGVRDRVKAVLRALELGVI